LKGDRICITAGTPHLEPHDELFLRAIEARCDLLRGRQQHAYPAAQSVFEVSRNSGYFAIAAYCAATAALCHGVADTGARAGWAVTALNLYAACGSTFDLAKDLFQTGIAQRPELLLAQTPDGTLVELYRCLQPCSPLNALPAFRELTASVVGATLMHTWYGEISQAATHRLIELAYDATGASAGSAPLAKELPHLAAFGEFLKVAVPEHRQGLFAERFTSSAGIIIRAITRALSHRRIRALSLVS
jgi:hypothetical protein